MIVNTVAKAKKHSAQVSQCRFRWKVMVGRTVRGLSVHMVAGMMSIRQFGLENYLLAAMGLSCRDGQGFLVCYSKELDFSWAGFAFTARSGVFIPQGGHNSHRTVKDWGWSSRAHADRVKGKERNYASF